MCTIEDEILDEQKIFELNKKEYISLKEKLKEFSYKQTFYLEKELEKEKDETLSLLENFDEGYLEKRGILIKDSLLIGKGFTSYGKVELEFLSKKKIIYIRKLSKCKM